MADPKDLRKRFDQQEDEQKKETEFRRRIRRLFSNNIITRQVGGKKLKVVDTDKRFRGDTRTQKLFRNTQFAQDNNSLYIGGYNINRMELFQEYEAMDTDGILSTALDVIADECTTKDSFGDMLKITSKDKDIEKILQNLFYDILNVDFNLWLWIRGMCKYGDFFLYLDVHPELGVANVIPLSAYEVIRKEKPVDTSENPDTAGTVKFELITGNTISKKFIENYEMAHFRLYSDSNFLPYGKSFLEPARREWKRLSLMEDAMMIYRIMRAPERRVFYIDTGNIAPEEQDAYMKKLIASMKKTPYIDPKTGDYNLRFNLENSLEDYFVPRRGEKSGDQIETLAGLTAYPIEDIEYLKDKMISALKVPKSSLNYTEELNGKATLAASDIRFSRTIERIQRFALSELYKIAMVHLYAQGFTDAELIDFELTLNNPSSIAEREKLEIWTEKFRVANDIKDSNLVSKKWLKEKIFDFSPEDMEEERLQIIKEAKEQYKLEQITQAGNDPEESGQHVDPNGQAVDGAWAQNDNEEPNSVDDLPSEDEAGKDDEKSKEESSERTISDDPSKTEDPLGADEYLAKIKRNRIKKTGTRIENKALLRKSLNLTPIKSDILKGLRISSLLNEIRNEKM